MAAFRKTLGKPGLISLIRECFDRIKSPVKGRKYSLSDYLMSAFAMFSLKYPSLLQFDQAAHNEKTIKQNLINLFKVVKVPCDTAIRKVIDLVDPEMLAAPFHSILAQLQRGKVLDEYKYIGGYLLIGIDGTGWFHSDKIRCEDCCEKHRRDGTISYYHQLLGAVILHPDHKAVLPFPPVPVKRNAGQAKNDCELNAARRMVEDIRRKHPHMKIILVLDGLYSNAPFIKYLEEHGMKYVITARSGDHKWLYEQLETNPDVECFETEHGEQGTRKYRYLENASLNASNPEIKVNVLEFWETDDKGKTTHFCWVTDLPVNKDTLVKIMRAGRARWRIENETFNTLKNHGYNFDHSYGHGKKHLSTNLGILMMLAFLVDQVELRCCQLFDQALKKTERMIKLRSKVRGLFDWFVHDDWETLYNCIIRGLDVVAAKHLLKPCNSS